MSNIKIEYDGKWPNLCRGHLKVTIDNTLYDFGRYSLSSGGSISHDGNWHDIETHGGEWYIDEWPDNFPEHLKQPVLNKINDEIPHGCCGGCI